MKAPTKVSIEITASGYVISVFADEELLASRRTIMNGPGDASAEVKGDWYDHEKEITPDLAEALDTELSFGPFEIANTLLRLQP